MKSEAAAVSGKFHVVMHNEFCAWKGWENVLGSLE
jgi:hypothetical protein